MTLMDAPKFDRRPGAGSRVPVSYQSSFFAGVVLLPDRLSFFERPESTMDWLTTWDRWGIQ